jgi:hypothetical protein
MDGVAARPGRCESVAQVAEVFRQRRCPEGCFGFREAQQQGVRGAAAQQLDHLRGATAIEQ